MPKEDKIGRVGVYIIVWVSMLVYVLFDLDWKILIIAPVLWGILEGGIYIQKKINT